MDEPLTKPSEVVLARSAKRRQYKVYGKFARRSQEGFVGGSMEDNQMKQIRNLGIYGALCLALSAPLFAADATAQPNFVTGGVGDEELASLNAVKPQYNVRLLLTQKDGAYVAGVPVTVVDRKGTTILESESKGPYFFVQLPDGNYRISATYEGKTLARTVSVKGNAARNVHFAW
ncbi:hypothetical protein GCM10007860_03500 [Chitiniphilus shinanonensis]|uniref:Carboxypeptidase regulatory-like domain-containing protein n=1 Tax=Chitiniphilus shinanonensis TaxID=553088 RepID=A0ABQ6BP27_9NEIS|nr:hypothetical protein [Chitiniphilus shinanonensis]GLS03207.1 hypothetical protein GCM10007860_03500 [Chitiniphilus shinanonensis]